MTTSQTLRGVFAPTLTPVHADLSPDAERFVAHSKWLLADGCHGLCPFGTTSEANSFSVGERIDLLDQLIDADVSPSVLMPGTGCAALTDSVTLTQHAVQAGCAGVLLLPPFYYKGVPDEGIFRAIAEVIERVGDDRLRVYLYHIPPVAQVGFNLKLIERLITAYPQTVVGIKDSSGDWNNLKSILTTFPGFGAFSGSERFVLETLRLGGAGAINAVANVIAGRLRKLYDNWQRDEAEALQEDVLVIAKARGEYAPIPVLKQIKARLTQDPAWLTLRPPLVQLNDAEAGPLLAKL
ncbi:MAG: dihydrodipicolinate synthase family protein, partial [Caldilineaceae bacterium]|nr:dihydrodipicolinate synthase family protein [Caldilineaceae bacterium]